MEQNTEDTINITFRCPTKLADELKAIAKQQGDRPLSSLIREYLEAAVNPVPDNGN